MDELIIDQLEYLFTGNAQGNRQSRILLILCGALGDEGLPEPIGRQMASLSRQVLLQDIFDALVNALNQFAKQRVQFDRAASDPHSCSTAELVPLIAQIELARIQLSACDIANQAELIAWISNRAKVLKLWHKPKRR